MLTMGSSAFADIPPITTFYLTVPENGSSCTTNCAPADTVLVSVDLLTNGVGTSTATITFTGETVAAIPYMMYSVEFNVDGTFGISSDTITQAGGSPVTTLSPGGLSANSPDQSGSFSIGDTVHDATSVEFTLDDGTWTTSAGVLAATTGYSTTYYSQGFDAAAQVITSNGGTKMLTLGFEGTTTGSSTVPEPTSILLFGSIALFVAGGLRRKFGR
jgi:hypothetical protein